MPDRRLRLRRVAARATRLQPRGSVPALVRSGRGATALHAGAASARCASTSMRRGAAAAARARPPRRRRHRLPGAAARHRHHRSAARALPRRARRARARPCCSTSARPASTATRAARWSTRHRRSRRQRPLAAPRGGRAHRPRPGARRAACAASILRVPGIYGPHRLPLERLQRGEPALRPEDAGPGNRIHVDDLVSACVAALERPVQRRLQRDRRRPREHDRVPAADRGAGRPAAAAAGRARGGDRRRSARGCCVPARVAARRQPPHARGARRRAALPRPATPASPRASPRCARSAGLRPRVGYPCRHATRLHEDARTRQRLHRVRCAPARRRCPSAGDAAPARRPAHRHRLRPGAGARAAAPRRHRRLLPHLQRRRLRGRAVRQRRALHRAPGREPRGRRATGRWRWTARAASSTRACGADGLVSVAMGVPDFDPRSLPFEAERRGAELPPRHCRPARSRSAPSRSAIRTP